MTPERDAQTPQPGEAVKQADTPKTLDDVPTDELVAAALTRRRHSRDGTPRSDRLALFADAELMTIARARLSARVLNRKILEDDARPLARATEPQPSAAVPAAWRRLRSS